jgi:hypothetical protein
LRQLEIVRHGARRPAGDAGKQVVRPPGRPQMGNVGGTAGTGRSAMLKFAVCPFAPI